MACSVNEICGVWFGAVALDLLVAAIREMTVFKLGVQNLNLAVGPFPLDEIHMWPFRSLRRVGIRDIPCVSAQVPACAGWSQGGTCAGWHMCRVDCCCFDCCFHVFRVHVAYPNSSSDYV